MREMIPYTDATFIKNYTEYESAFKKIKLLVNENMAYEEIKELIEIKYQIPLIQFFYPNLKNVPTYLYRVRKANGFKEDKLIITSFSAPPNEKSQLGRANIKGKSVLYTSFLPQTAINELNIQRGEEIYFSTWEFKKDITLGGAIFLKHNSFMPPAWSKIIHNHEEKIKHKFSCYNQNTAKSLWYIKNKLAEWFLEKENYLLSSFLAHYCLYDTNISQYDYSIDCIIYPSVSDGFQSANIALSTNSLNKIELKSIIKGSFDYANDNGILLIALEVGKGKDFEIQWRNASHVT